MSIEVIYAFPEKNSVLSHNEAGFLAVLPYIDAVSSVIYHTSSQLRNGVLTTPKIRNSRSLTASDSRLEAALPVTLVHSSHSISHRYRERSVRHKTRRAFRCGPALAFDNAGRPVPESRPRYGNRAARLQRGVFRPRRKRRYQQTRRAWFPVRAYFHSDNVTEVHDEILLSGSKGSLHCAALFAFFTSDRFSGRTE